MAPDGDRFPAARGARSLNFFLGGRQSFSRIEKGGRWQLWDLSWLLVGYGRCSYFPICLQVAVAIDLCRPTPTAFASRFPSFELEARFQPTPDVVYHKGPLVERSSKGREKLHANSLNF